MTTKQDYMRRALGGGSSGRPADAPGAPVSVPRIAPFADWDYYYLLVPIAWEPEGDAIGRFPRIEAPRGFVTDLASIPSVLWGVLPPTSRYTHAAIIHDYLYWTQTVTRDEADEILKLGMKELDVPGWQAFTVYQAVSKLGGGAWRNNAQLKAQGEKRFLREFPEDPKATWAEWKARPAVFAG